MSSPSILGQFLRRVRREVRTRRAERGAWRGTFWGLIAATVLLAFKGSLEDERLATLFAIGAVLAAIAGWAITGYVRRIGELEAARLADRAFGLQDRLATTVECMAQPARPAMAQALIGETATKVESLERRPVTRRTYPWEARFAVLPFASALALAVAPAFPDPHAWLKEHLRLDPASARSAVPAQDRAAAFGTQLQQREQQAAQDALRRASAAEQAREGEAGAFKDRALKQQQSDFASFVKKGDDRLRMLEHSDRLPDLQSDFASSQYRLMMRKTRELGAGKGPQQLSTAKLGQILREMERLGRKGGEWSEDAMEGLEALDDGNMEGAMDSLQSALGKLREAEDRQRSSRNLRGGRDLKSDEGDDGRGEAGSNMNDADRRGYSSAKSKGANASGKATPRLRSTPYDAAIAGARNGRAPMYDTQMTSRPGSGAMNLQYLSEFGQYRRLMEDAITREQVPRDYHDQIRDYFKSLNEQ